MDCSSGCASFRCYCCGMQQRTHGHSYYYGHGAHLGAHEHCCQCRFSQVSTMVDSIGWVEETFVSCWLVQIWAKNNSSRPLSFTPKKELVYPISFQLLPFFQHASTSLVCLAFPTGNLALLKGGLALRKVPSGVSKW